MFVDEVVILTGGGRFDGEGFDGGAIDQEGYFVGAGDAFDVFVAIAGEADLELVFGVDGEGVSDDFAAAGAEGETVEGILLGEVGREIEGFAAGGAGGGADGEAGDFAGGGEVAFEQCRGEIANGDVVETVAGFVGGEEVGDVDVDGEEVADGVLVFGAVEAAEGVGATGVRGEAVEGFFEGSDGGQVGGFGRVGDTEGRHGAAAEAAEHFFPAFGVLGGGGIFEVEIATAGGSAVAAEAVFVDESLLGRWGLRGGGEGRQAIQGLERKTAHDTHYT